MIRIPAAASTAPNAVVNLASRSRMRNLKPVGVVEVHQKVASLLGHPRITAVLLTASEATIRDRLSAREIGIQLDAHLAKSATMARHPETTAPPSVIRIPTDNRTITGIAHDIIAATGWSAHPTWTSNHEVRAAGVLRAAQEGKAERTRSASQSLTIASCGPWSGEMVYEPS
jgi:hypothetical protein